MIKDINHKRIVRFLISGGSAAAVEYGTFTVFTVVLFVPVVIANTVSFLCGFVVSFLLNKHWVFKAKGNAKKQMTAYAILAVVNLGLSNGLIWLLVYFGVLALVAKFITMAAIAVWNYVFFSRYIFKHVESGDIQV